MRFAGVALVLPLIACATTHVRPKFVSREHTEEQPRFDLHLVWCLELECEVCQPLVRDERCAKMHAQIQEFRQEMLNREALRLIEDDTPAEALERTRAAHLPPDVRPWGSP